MVNVALLDAIEEYLRGDAPVRTRRPRKQTPFNFGRRQQKINNTREHCARNPDDNQAKAHLAGMVARLEAQG